MMQIQKLTAEIKTMPGPGLNLDPYTLNHSAIEDCDAYLDYTIVLKQTAYQNKESLNTVLCHPFHCFYNISP